MISGGGEENGKEGDEATVAAVCSCNYGFRSPEEPKEPSSQNNTIRTQTHLATALFWLFTPY